jgi:CHAT domain-containing protein/Tfp pilus assembly protein PilF
LLLGLPEGTRALGTNGTAAQSAELLESRELIHRAVTLYGEGKYDEALPLVERAVALSERALGPEHPEVARALATLGELHRVKGDYARAEPHHQRALAIYEATLGAEHEATATTLGNLALLNHAKGDYARAEQLYLRSLAIFQKTLGSDHAYVATTNNNLASLYNTTGDYAQAEVFYQRALTVFEKVLGPQHASVATLRNNLAELYRLKGDYARAESMYQRALEIFQKAGAETHPDYATALNNLAVLYQERGDYARAEPLSQRVVAIEEKALGPQHPRLARSLYNLAKLYWAKGDFANAEPLAQRSLAILEASVGAEHPDTGRSLDSLASLYQSKGDYARAERIYLRSLLILEKALGPEHPDVATSQNNLAELYQQMGDFARAEPLHQRALASKEKLLGADHPHVARSLNNLALLYEVMGDYARAESLYQRSLAIVEKALGPEHPDNASSLANLAGLYSTMGATVRAVQSQTRANEIREHNFRLILATGSEKQKLLYLATFAFETDATVWLHVHFAPGDKQAAHLALTTILRRKGRALDAMTDQIGALRQRLNPQDRELLDQLAAAQRQLSNLVLNGPGGISSAAYRAAIVKLETEVDQLQAAISVRSAEFSVKALPVTLEQVQRAIPSGAALVELVFFRPYDAKARKYEAARYAAYVLQNDGFLAWSDLGEAAAIEKDVARLRAALSNPESSDVRLAARAVDERVMRPIRRLLGTTTRVFLSPDGILNLVPFAALVDERDRYLVEDYSITYLTSGRDLLRMQVFGEARQPPVVFANPQFGATTAAINSAANGPGCPCGRRSGDMAEMRFEGLPGTADEARALGSILNVAPLTEARATETALKQVASPRILHIATHGFFLTDPKPDLADSARGMVLARERQATTSAENPLLRSGLALAGANARQSPGGEDGILTALEAAGLNLWGTKLVALSACETGVGEVSQGNGVYGLRRALLLAGSETQVMSLWQVSDVVTRDLMVAYYKRLEAGEGRTEALRAVQLEMMRSGGRVASGENRDLGLSKTGTADRGHPFFWAAFIQSGDWRSMVRAANK